MNGTFEHRVLAELDRWQKAGKVARFWLRDDDATVPTPALDRLLALTAHHNVPVALAVIPEPTAAALAERLSGAPHARVAVHGWAHANHAVAPDKKSELGAQRPAAIVLGELQAGLVKLSGLYGPQCMPLLVPPWNRIDPALLPRLGALGFRAVSVYGPERAAPLPVLNTHVDVMDWHGSRGCRDWEELGEEIVGRLQVCFEDDGTVGILTHHLVHDEAVWMFLDRLFTATHDHPACRWAGAADLMP